ncbi:MAG: hypothetical protein FLDDKLPJ_02405 [Phycisphaerae bacterium]|nr:hypothetical protein [Phycisphaerae bacterium]
MRFKSSDRERAPRVVRRCGTRGLCAAATTLAGVLTLAAPPRADAQNEDAPTLAERLTRYFKAASAQERFDALAGIEESGAAPDAVAAELSKLKLWINLNEGASAIEVEAGWSRPIRGSVFVPPAYDPERSHPLMIVLPDEGGAAPCATLPRDQLAALCDPPAVIISLEDVPEATFDAPGEEAAVVERLLAEFRRRVHVDEDRVYLLGAGVGGDAAWRWALAHPDAFAGLLVEDGYPRLPCATQLIPLLFENIPDLPVLSGWRASADLPDEPHPEGGILVRRDTAVAAHNRAIRDWPGGRVRFSGTEWPADADRGQRTHAPAALRAFFNARRPAPAKTLIHRFRHPQQGKSGWLVQARFLGEVWTHPQLSILPGPASDAETYITSVLKEKLASMSGRIEGQTITLEVTHCDRIEVLLSPGLVDLTKPVTLICNGKRRFDGVVRPSVRTMLEHARQTWTFQRPVLAKLAFNIDAAAMQP